MKNNKFKLNSILSSMIVAGSLSMVAQAAEPADTSVDQAAEEQIETIIVSGFRGSLSRAMFEKRNAVNSKETIMSEDLGKFPDLNLTESLQRVPGGCCYFS